MMTVEQRKQLSEIFDELGKNLDITQAQYDAAVRSYEFVGDWLSRPESLLQPYNPEILPQGSFLLGTMIRPVHEEDDLDVDLVCRLDGKKASWTQFDLKKIVGDRLKQHDTLKRMLDKEGRRCWTLVHRESARFHLDILPAIISQNFRVLFEKTMSESELQQAVELAIRITDKFTSNYHSATDPAEWLKSNPFGYAAWFKMRSSLAIRKAFSLNEAVQPVPDFTAEKEPLVRIVQLFKRHRDILFAGDDDKPISIIITTLAAKAYNKQTDLSQAMIEVANAMENYIELKFIPALGRTVKWISNPVNPEENFADKWPANPKKEQNFYRWLRQLKEDLSQLTQQRGLHKIQESMAPPFGPSEVRSAFSSIAERTRENRENGLLKMAGKTGIISEIGRTGVRYHNNYGANE